MAMSARRVEWKAGYQGRGDDDPRELELELGLAPGPESQFAVFFGMFHLPVTTPPFFAPVLSCG
jgi:hypothetical protein